MPETNAPTRIIGYFTAWSLNRCGYTAAQIPGDLLTHINYAFAVISPDRDEVVPGFPREDLERAFTAEESVDGAADTAGGPRGHYHQMRKLKQKYPHLKILMSIGGWEGSDRFSDIALTEASRRSFARSCVELFLQQHAGAFDGIDIDWEFPVGGGMKTGRPEDRHNYTLLLKELREQLDAQSRVDGRPYFLTIAAPASPSILENNQEIDQIHPYLDWINLMTYDFHGVWDSITNFNAPLYAAPEDPAGSRLNTHAAVRAYVEAGVPKDKLVVGVPFNGRGWQGVPGENHGLYQPAAGPSHGTYHAGAFDYTDLKRNYIPRMERHWHAAAQVPWLYDPRAGLMISYDDPESIRAKAAYVQSHELGGIMIWELSQDGGELLRVVAEEFVD